MKTNKWILMLIGVAAILMAGQNAWADGKRDGRGHGGKAYQTQKYHGGGGNHHKKPQHGGPAVHHRKKPHHGGPAVHHSKRPHHPQGHQYDRRPHRRPEPRPYYHEHHRRPPHHHHEDNGGFLFSASIFDPAFALSIITGERW